MVFLLWLVFDHLLPIIAILRDISDRLCIERFSILANILEIALIIRSDATFLGKHKPFLAVIH